MLDKERVRLKVTGDFACFTRPDLKVERMSYPCMTPSAARGVLEAILWKPEFQWFIHRIIVLNPIKFTSIKRNEIKKRQNMQTGPIDISAVDNSGKPQARVQRNSIVLKDVAYIIEASVHVPEEIIEKTQNSKNPISVKKYREMFNRRVRNGQCWHQPYLGTREFSADFSLPSENDKPLEFAYPIGSMLFDLFYDYHKKEMKGRVKNELKATPIYFYDAAIIDGVLECPEDCSLKMLNSIHIQPDLSDSYNRLVYEQYEKEETDL